MWTKKSIDEEFPQLVRELNWEEISFKGLCRCGWMHRGCYCIPSSPNSRTQDLACYNLRLLHYTNNFIITLREAVKNLLFTVQSILHPLEQNKNKTFFFILSLQMLPPPPLLKCSKKVGFLLTPSLIISFIVPTSGLFSSYLWFV